MLIGGTPIEKGGEAVKLDSVGGLNLQEDSVQQLHAEVEERKEEERKEEEEKKKEPLAVSSSPEHMAN